MNFPLEFIGGKVIFIRILLICGQCRTKHGVQALERMSDRSAKLEKKTC